MSDSENVNSNQVLEDSSEDVLEDQLLEPPNDKEVSHELLETENKQENKQENIQENETTENKQENIQESELNADGDYIQNPTFPAIKLPISKKSTPPKHAHFECDTCGRSFSKKCALIFHFRSHGPITYNVENVPCPICNKRYKTKYTLQKHIRFQHNKERPFKCTECDKQFTVSSHLKRHYSMHKSNSRKPLKCSVCTRRFNCLSSKRTHERMNHCFQCAHCNKGYGTKNGLVFHIHTAHFSGFEKMIECPTSTESLSLKNRRSQVPLKKSVPKKNGPFLCDHCDNKYKYKEFLNRHLREDHALGNTLLKRKERKRTVLQCAHCDEKYGRKCELINHIRRIHFPELFQKGYKCKSCDSYFSCIYSRNRHERTVHATEAHFRCKHCGQRYRYKIYLIRHLRKYHANTRDEDGIEAYFTNEISGFRCTICNKTYSCKSTLRLHIREKHEGVKPFQCDECGKRFSRQSILKQHISVHGSKKPFKCSVCNKGFKRPESKISHERIVHDRLANFQCAHCDGLFITKNCLASHIYAKHFSKFQKPFKCTICNKSFALMSRLRKHKSIHISRRSIKCSFCDFNFKSEKGKLLHEKTIHG